MNSYFQSEKPVPRLKLRMYLGKLYFTLRRYLKWICNRSIKYAFRFKAEELPYRAASHKTPLYRQLRNVDMWLQENKVTNLKIACEKLNKITLRPGRRFPFGVWSGNPQKQKAF